MKPGQKYYLLAYNGIAFLAWLSYGICYLAKNDLAIPLLIIAQGLAILEVLHAATGLVRSPIGSTAAQVASRLLVVVLLLLFISDEEQYWHYIGLMVVTVAWTITELVRYSFYFLGLLGREPRWLLWMRYTFFIILYPLGVTGEWLIILSPLIAYGFTATSPESFWHTGATFQMPHLYYSIFVGFLALSYIYYFPVLYRYMWHQRRKKLGAAL